MDEFHHQVDDRTFFLPGFLPGQAGQGIGRGDNHHVQVMEENDQISPVPPGVIKMMLPCSGGPPEVCDYRPGSISGDPLDLYQKS